jgi:hypothetical protein
MKSRAKQRGDEETSPLDPTARGALRRLVRIVHRCGCSPAAIERAVRDEIRALPTAAAREPSPVETELPLAPEVMTAWFSDVPFVDAKGNPIPLKRAGNSPSFESLVRKVNPALDPDNALRYLMRAGSVRFHRGRYWAINRVVILRGIAGPRDVRALRGVDAMLRTAEQNLSPASEGPGWLERTAYNDHVPTRLLPAFAVFLERESMRFLRPIDAWLHNAASEAKGGEPTVGVTVGAYHSQDVANREPAKRTRKRSRTRSKRTQ